MEHFASYGNMLVVSWTIPVIKRFMEDLGGSVYRCPFSEVIISPGSLHHFWGQQFPNLTHIKSGTKSPMIDIPYFRLQDSLRTLGLFQMKMTSVYHLKPIDIITQTQMDFFIFPTCWYLVCAADASAQVSSAENSPVFAVGGHPNFYRSSRCRKISILTSEPLDFETKTDSLPSDL